MNRSGVADSVEDHLAVQAEDAFRGIQIDYQPMVERAKSLVVEDGPSYAVGSELIVAMAGIERRVEDRRTYFTAPLNTIIKGINTKAREYLASLMDGKSAITRKMGAYQQELEKKRREEVARQQVKIEKALDQGKLMPTLKPVEEVPKTIQTASGSHVTMRDVVKFEVVTPALVPEEYKMVDEVKIGKVVRAGIREIPGVRIWMEKTASVR